MYSEGDIVLFRYPNADGSRGKRRPAVLIKCVGNKFGDWVVCMVSTQLQHCVEGLEVVITAQEPDVLKRVTAVEENPAREMRRRKAIGEG